MFDIAKEYVQYLHEDREKNERLWLLLSSLERYVNGAIIEMRRLDRTRKMILKEFRNVSESADMNGKSFYLTYMAVDTHFYFICIDKVYMLLHKIAEELSDDDIEKLAERLNSFFEIKTVRGHLEHIDERCLGFLNKKDAIKGKRTFIQDFGNFMGESFTFAGQGFPIGKQSLIELKQIYTDLIEILHNSYASKNDRFIREQYQRQRLEKIEQDLKDMGLL